MAFNSIPAERIVSVVPSAVGTGGTPIEMATLLIVDKASPRIIGVRQFGSASEVAQVFGIGSGEAQFADRYYAGYEGATKIPQTLWVVGGKETAQGAILQSATLRGVEVDDIAVAGELTLTVGSTPATVNVDLTEATSFSQMASIMTTALTTAGVIATFVPSAQVFELTTVATGATQKISYGSGVMAATLRLREEDGALVEGGTDPMGIDALMEYSLGFTLNFGVITSLTELAADEKKNLAKWITLRKSRFLGIVQDTNGSALVANNSVSFGAWLKETEQDGTLPYFGTIDKIAALCGGIDAIDFKRTNGRRNIMFMRQAGLEADVTSEPQYTALISNGYTFYAAFATANDRFIFQTNGAVSGKFLWADTYVNQIYLNSQLQLALMTMLMSYGSIPYNDVGKAYHRSALQDPIDEMINFGGISALVDPSALSSQQKSVINAQAGRDVIPELLSKGYAIVIQTADAQTRGKRGSMPAALFYSDAGSVQNVNLASVTVL